MLSSPISSNPPPRLDSSRVKRPCDDHSSRIMETIDSNQHPLQDNHRSHTTFSATLGSTPLPPVTARLSFYARRAASRFKPYELGGHVPTALEHRFMKKNISKGQEVDLSQIDVHQGKDIFEKGMKRMTDATVQSAVTAKRADAECKRLRALATAWEIESTEKHAALLQDLLRDEAEQYVASLIEASFFERVLVKHSKQQLEDDVDFTVAAYTYDFAAHRIADMQLDQLEEVGAERSELLPEDDGDSEHAENRLVQCLNSITKEPLQNHMVTVS